MKVLKPNWPAVTKKQQREVKLIEKTTNETAANREKRRKTKTTRIFRLYAN